MESGIIPTLSDFYLSEERGFLPAEDPLESLPPYFSPWVELARDSPKLLQQQQLRECVHKLPLLDHTRLQGPLEWHLAHLLLSTIGHAYVWQAGEAGVPDFLPRSVAVPWYHVSEHLGVPPIISHHCVSLANWKKKDPKGPLELDNLQLLFCITCPRDFSWFALIPLQIEIDFIAALPLVLEAQKGVLEGNSKSTRDALTAIIPVLKKMKQTLGRMKEQCDTEVFYNQLRYFLSGWKDNPALPRGLIYEGVRDEPFQLSGGSAAQVATIQCLDEFLGIKHNGREGAFLMRMRDHMLPAHRNFIADVGKGPSVRNFVSNTDDQELRTAYNTCVSTLRDFRSLHISIIASYIVIPSKRAKGHKVEGLANVGTGGTGIMTFLKSVRDTTTAALLPDVSGT
ncbi:indoleamine 2,3-dioxygenase 2-like [Branchiostoma floridae]|uniref:Indoleamine 2,3-dioxygenase 2-like n=1 Tax=Branchiostoma floridae TaxID=7739 RepID=A0A9J7MH14_BRAFL|nr:indoleamine 2,3-dioxygenase 2-like [Branchiostoma floridae]